MIFSGLRFAAESGTVLTEYAILLSVIGEPSLFDREGKRKYLNAVERMKFYDSAASLTHADTKAFCLTLFYTGCRISEALNLVGGSVDPSEGTLVFRTLKQRDKERYRAVPVADELIELLKIKPGTAPSECLWGFSRQTGWTMIKNQMDAAGLSGIKATPKGLRHGFAVACVQQNVPIHTVQKWMGHARAETTAIYLDFVGEDERAWARKVWPEGH